MVSDHSTPRVALVTGTSSGIGAAVVAHLRAQGHQVLAVDFNPAGREVAEAEGAVFHEADLTQAEACRGAVDEALRRFGRLDILVNNAGIQHVAPIEEFPQEKWRQIIDLMLTAPFLLTQAAWPSMRENGWGRIVNIASVHAQVASPGKAAYISAKHGMIGLTKTAALEGGAQGITANALCPAYVKTPLVDNQIADQARLHGMEEQEVIEQIMLKNAAVKRLIDPSEVASLVGYLASDAAGAVTGASWNIDLGWTAQ
ncbi:MULTISPECIES: 3-hydroxybutyrate dehydrogenase [unclassified Halomonas]|uniref:3-hydroxybutyrate dehydrogenase n=1 Tax=Halomonas sp. RT37 TaxID=2950872 RepID=A0AAU7KNS5_9GAMM|nr:MULTISPECIES: 3-hydroxybutyrate dehydrogenase [unclassified Halomonas]MBR9879186.1 3-hydroxybutyrate dehydrogenase [Gammaproteobacteria bacterium]MBS8269336.1 3-hydroxybutyrate dehydrogenase [Halomonas litopenaei]MAR70946.1 D-beta-hydroxybutyrate dehydrogenase [Halomonas sp.]MBY5941343.1 3-hydroxybutyrate dehydrogenase [Halomonas sp. DP5N14-9]MBY6111910.1 3-hydroxybutyrate dehydrogenase [Halomonas sp. DP1Y21-3]